MKTSKKVAAVAVALTLALAPNANAAVYVNMADGSTLANGTMKATSGGTASLISNNNFDNN